MMDLMRDNSKFKPWQIHINRDRVIEKPSLSAVVIVREGESKKLFVNEKIEGAGDRERTKKEEAE